MQIKEVAVDKLIPYAKNSRTHSPEQVGQIAASIKEFGFRNPILVDGVGIIAGHGRLMAAQKLGLDKVPTIDCSDMTESQKKAYIIADNKLAMNAGWDTAMLSIEMKDLEDEGFDLALLGFDDKELNALLEPEVSEGLTDEDAVPDVPEEPKTKVGDIYILGNHRLMCGDSCSITDMEKLVNSRQVDMWLTDPPYNVAYEGKTKDALTIQNDSMDNEGFRQFLRDAYVTADTVMKAGAVFYIWHADSEGYNFRGAAHDAGWKVRQCLIWKKSTMVMGRQDYHWKHEPCLYGWKEGAGHLWATDRKQTTILEFDKPNRNKEHPTMKPIPLIAYQIGNSSKQGDIIADAFRGSGTTMVASEQMGRRCRMVELDPKYCQVIIDRMQKLDPSLIIKKNGVIL
jgi:site-specific DNA-methyltransferase (adenine-specific)